MRRTARSVDGSRPATCPAKVRPSRSRTVIARASSITWLLVSTAPSAEKMTPEPSPCSPPSLRESRYAESPPPVVTSICTTAGLARSAMSASASLIRRSSPAAAGEGGRGSGERTKHGGWERRRRGRRRRRDRRPLPEGRERGRGRGSSGRCWPTCAKAPGAKPKIEARAREAARLLELIAHHYARVGPGEHALAAAPRSRD